MNSTGKTSLVFTPDAAMQKVRAGLDRRYRAERRFRRFGLAAIFLGLLFLVLLLVSIVDKGYSAFQQTWIDLDVTFDEQLLDPTGQRDPAVLSAANYGGLVKDSLRDMFPDVTGRSQKRQLYGLVSGGAAFQLRNMVLKDPGLIGTTQRIRVPANDDVDMLMKGHIDRNQPSSRRRLGDDEIAWIDRLADENRIGKSFNTTFFTAGDSREPELAGSRCRFLPDPRGHPVAGLPGRRGNGRVPGGVRLPESLDRPDRGQYQ